MRRPVDVVHRRYARRLLLVALSVLVMTDASVGGLSSDGAALAAGTRGAAQPRTSGELTLDFFQTSDAPCYDGSAQSQTAIVDTRVHFRPFGGPAVPFEEIPEYFEATGVMFAYVYGVGQMPPASSSSCTYYLDCPGTPVTPTLKNDLVNAANVVTKAPEGLHLTLAMTFPDLADPESVLDDMALLDAEYPGLFRWMGEVNLVNQAPLESGLNGSRAAGFEELRAQLARAEAPAGGKFERKGIPDAGVQCFCALCDDTEWGWQAKYFTTLGDSQFPQSSPDTPAAEATAGWSTGSEGTQT